MQLNNKIKKFPSFLTEEFNKIIEMPQPTNKDGLIYKREPRKLTVEESNYVADNQIPY
jgi:hypothetical protein